jgi:23S rRNA pseudouridine1911/1915/1917 synthase
MKTRLYKYLIQYFRSINELGYTVPEIKRNIESCGVLVNGKLTHKQLEWVWDDSRIEIPNWPKRVLGDLTLIKIIYEDQYCIVINKPYGLVVEPGSGHVLDNVVTWLLDNYPEQYFASRYKTADLTKLFAKYDIVTKSMENASGVFTLPATGMVHRIDKNTQGLLLIAKDLDSYVYFQKQFRQHTVTKKYLAVVQGIIEHNYIVNNFQSRDYGNPIRNRLFWLEKDALYYSPDTRNARSIIKPLLNCVESNQSLIEVQIMTGRMHQIRLQCEALGFPLVGDNVYKSNSTIQYDFDLNLENKKFLGLDPVGNCNLEEFEATKKEIFSDYKYCLLSNQLSIELPSGERLQLRVKEV